MLTRAAALLQTLPPSLKRRLPLLAKAAATLGVLWLLGWLVLPWVVKPQLERLAGEALGRTVQVDAVHFRPWTLELEILGVRVGLADQVSATENTHKNTFHRLSDGESQLFIQRVYADAELASLLRLAPVLDAVQIDQPVLHVRHMGQGKHDWQDVLDKLTAPTDPPAPDTGPTRLAIYNIQLRNGQIDLYDAPHDNRHAVTDITLAIPFISTLGVAKEVRVQPQLAFKLNGSPFETEATAQPFHAQLTTDATLRISGFNLTPYLDYLPADLPVRPVQATLGAELKVAFAHNPHASVRITGHVRADDVALADAHQQPLLKLAQARVELADVRPLERVALLGEVALTDLYAHLSRDAQGLLNVTPSASKNVANAPNRESDRAQKSLKKSNAPSATPPSWTLGLTALKLTGGNVGWTDAAMPDAQQQPAKLSLSQLQFNASQLRWPLPTDAAQVVAFDAEAQLTGSTTTASVARPASKPTGKTPAPKPSKPNQATNNPKPAVPARLNLTGTVLASQADATVAVSDLALSLLAPYLRPHLVPTAHGQLAFKAHATWKPGATTTPSAAPSSTTAAAPAAPATTTTADELTLTLNQLELSAFKLLAGNGAEAASLQALSVRDAQIKPLARTINLGSVTVTRPVLPVQRDKDGQLMFAQWLGAASATQASAATPQAQATPADATAVSTDTPWAWQLPELTVTDGQFGWADATTTPAVALQTSAFKLHVQGLVSRGGPAAAVVSSMRVGTGQTEPGSLGWRGTLTLGDDGQTPRVQGKLDALRLPAHALAPYTAAQLNLTLLRADASFDGTVAYTAASVGPSVHLAGHATLENFRADAVATSQTDAEEWLRWKTLNLRGLDVKLAPATAPQVSVERGALSDFFARVAIDESGRINLQDISKQVAAEAAASAATATSPTTGTGAGKAPAIAPATPAPADPLATRISIGPFSLVNGAVDFSDKFIRPNYRANLSDLTGRLGGFSSDGAVAQADGQSAPQMAELALRGKAEGTASLEIVGKLNPLAKPLALDIEGRVRDLELPPLSPYTIKYTGHGIERGKLSLDVNYTVLPNGLLTARNQLVLNQLTFGDAVPGAPASLPVKLATALLSDRNGVIDLNLPISGSLNDPEFSLVPVIFKIIGNIIVKAITAPFSLLTGALGGSDAELATVAFVPGTAQLLPDASDKLARVAKALADRPALTLTVVGTASLEDERTAYQRERLHTHIRAERQRNTPNATDPLPQLTPGSAEHTRWLTALYKRTDMPKPRNALGFAQELPPADMEALLLAQIPVNDTTMKELAVQRGVAVRDQLLRQAIPSQRLFLGAPGAAPAHTAGNAAAPVAHLQLSMQ